MINASSKGIACSKACNQRTKLFKMPYMTQFPTWKHRILENCLLISGHIITFHVQWKQNLDIMTRLLLTSMRVRVLANATGAAHRREQGLSSVDQRTATHKLQRDFPNSFLNACEAKPHHCFPSGKSFEKKSLGIRFVPSLKKIYIYISAASTHNLCHEWVVFLSFLLYLSATKTSSGVCGHNPM